MSSCVYCGQRVFLGKHHSRCERLHTEGLAHMIAIAAEYIECGEPLSTLQDRLAEVADSSYISKQRLRDVLIRGWEHALDIFLSKNTLGKREEMLLDIYATHFGLSHIELNKKGAYTRQVMAQTLRDVLGGKLITHEKLSGAPVPVALEKDEALLWLFPATSLFEDDLEDSLLDEDRLTPIVVLEGHYFAIDNFNGPGATANDREAIDMGYFGVTSRRIFFSGTHMKFSVAFADFDKCVAHTDGVCVYKTDITTSPLFFQTGEGWFIYNLLVNLLQRWERAHAPETHVHQPKSF